MSVLLRIAAVFALGWAGVLFAAKEQLFGAGSLSPLTRAFANGLAITQLVFAFVFWYAAAAPQVNRAAIYAAIMWMALRTANDLYQLLVLLPPDQALISLADLVISVALLVGILEALPRLVARTGADAQA